MLIEVKPSPSVGEKPDGWQPSGKRIKRGLYQASSGQLINADCNGSANIITKVITQLKVSLAKVSRGVLSLPQRYDLDRLSRSYRKRCEASIYKGLWGESHSPLYKPRGA